MLLSDWYLLEIVGSHLFVEIFGCSSVVLAARQVLLRWRIGDAGGMIQLKIKGGMVKMAWCHFGMVAWWYG